MLETILTVVGSLFAGILISYFASTLKNRSVKSEAQDSALTSLQKTVTELILKIALVKKDTEMSITQQQEIIKISKLIDSVITESKYTKEKIDEICKRVSILEDKFDDFKEKYLKKEV